jgi:hypothetical protein
LVFLLQVLAVCDLNLKPEYTQGNNTQKYWLIQSSERGETFLTLHLSAGELLLILTVSDQSLTVCTQDAQFLYSHLAISSCNNGTAGCTYQLPKQKQ